MVYMVDANLRSSTVRLVRLALVEEHRVKSNDDLASGPGEVVAEKMRIFCNLLKNVIRKKLSRFTTSELDNLTLSSSVFLGEGHGSIEISEPPTEAQGRIIKSLVKVVFHQMEKKRSSDNFEDLDEGHANLFLSLFIKRIHCDVFEESSLLTLNQSSHFELHERICKIVTGCENAIENKPQLFPTVYHDGFFVVHLYCCLEDNLQDSGSDVLLEEFDKIDLDDDDGSEDGDPDGPTLTSLSIYSGLISKLRVSKQTLSQTKITLLPSQDFEGLWESLHFDDRIKQRFYSYATVALKIASLSKDVEDDSYMDILANNKLLLVHGPPGTGKTTICKALCHKLSIRREFSQEVSPIDTTHKGIVVEISCSQIFSRWFGESSKNLATIFNDVENLLKINQQNASFVCLLIDEVEAIAFSRSDLLNKNESTDGVRVVSTLLTQLDRLKKYNNLLVLATSNLIESLDPAFVDRTDGSFYIGNPSKNGIVEILSLGLRGLISKGIISVLGDSSDILESPKYKQIMITIADKCLVCDIQKLFLFQVNDTNLVTILL